MMDYRRILHATAEVARVFSLLMILPIIVALVYEPFDTSVLGLQLPRNVLVFLASGLLMALYWLPVMVGTSAVKDDDLQDREAYLVVGIGWLVLTLFAMMPFLLSRTFDNPVDAWFEAMSGLTTTGATAISGQLEDVARSVMFWRALLQYIGGMGIIVLSVAVLARLTHGGVQLLQAETPGPSVTKLAPKLAQTAKTLWLVYAIFSGILFVILAGLFIQHGMTGADAIYDALIHTFTTLSTGGFSNHTESIAYYDSWLIEAVIMAFMLVAATNFTLLFHAGKGDFRTLLRDREWRFFMGMFVGIVVVSTGMLWRLGQGLADALRDSLFTVATMATGTGYVTADYNAWPASLKLILIILMLTGGAAGSTTGGMKVVRIMLLIKVVRRELRKLLHPRAVIPIRLGGRVLKEETLFTAIAFFFSFITLWMVGAWLLIVIEPGMDAFSGAALSAASIANIGPSMGLVGPTDHAGDLTNASKLLMTALMWVGRLEVFTALLLFSPNAWRK
ncbi:MAG: TrkH family potassium uptake protein [Thermoplasmatota archaeon]